MSNLKQNVPGLFTIHCVIRQQHLVAKNLSARLHQSLRHKLSKQDLQQCVEF